MSSRTRKHWPVILTLCILLLVVVGLLILALNRTEGHFIYVLDDTYIHMAMAKHFALSGVWGITPFEFSSSSSSPLWTLLLSVAFYIFGPHEVIPIILAGLFAVITIIVAYKLLESEKISHKLKFIILLSLTLAIPIPVLIFQGMEHILHVLLTLTFVFLSARVLCDKPQTQKSPYLLSLCVLAALLTATRYESMYVITAVCVLFAARRLWRYSLLLIICAVLPIAVYGIISKSYGWLFLPNSVAIKGSTRLFDHLDSPGYISLHVLSSMQRLARVWNLFIVFYLAIMVGTLSLKYEGWVWKRSQVMLAVFAIATAAHPVFGKLGHFNRYEAYLIALGLFSLWLFFIEQSRVDLPDPTIKRRDVLPHKMIVLLMTVVVSAVVVKGVCISGRVPQAARNIYEQQYQMALFIRQYYNGQVIGANDIGAINYFGDIRCVDLYGLGSIEIAVKKLHGGYGKADLGSLARSKKMFVAVCYDSWVRKSIPSNWVKVAEWEIRDNYIAGNKTVSFYSSDPSRSKQLASNLREFSARLPERVIQRGYVSE